MHTKDVLAAALREAGLEEMAAKAADGYYHDYLSPLPDPAMQLDRDLWAAVKGGNLEAGILRSRHHNGDFDASSQESDDWARSADGQQALGTLLLRDVEL